MKQIIKIILGFLFLVFFTQAFAIEPPKNIKLEEATDDSLKISWDEVNDAGVYAISYGTVSASGSDEGYEHELEEVVSEPEVTLKNLDSNTKYYIAIKAYDSEENESEYSEEVSFNTLTEGTSLKIEDIDLIDTRNILLKFNLNLKKDSLIDINLVNDNDYSDSIKIEKYNIDGQELKLFLASDLVKAEDYKLTVLALEGENGETIEQGVNGEADFYVPENLKDYSEEEVNLNSAGIEQEGEDKENENKNNEVQVKEEEIKEIGKKIIGGKKIGKIDTKNEIIEKVAKDKKKLPKTGPAETLLLLLAFIIPGIFIFFRRKQA